MKVFLVLSPTLSFLFTVHSSMLVKETRCLARRVHLPLRTGLNDLGAVELEAKRDDDAWFALRGR